MAYSADYVWTKTGFEKDIFWVTKNNEIIDVVNKEMLRKKYSNAIIEFYDNCALLPCFIDYHTHFELFELHKRNKFSNLFELMIAAGDYHKNVENIRNCRSAQYYSLLHGIGNSLDWRSTSINENDYLYFDRVYPFFEIIDTIGDKPLTIMKENVRYCNSCNKEYGLAPHSLYMVTPQVMERTIQNNRPLSIHLAEDKSEQEWIVKKKGELFEHCIRRSGIAQIEHASSYFKVIDDEKLCGRKCIFVHGTTLTRDDLINIKNSGEVLCICPRSNIILTGRTIDFREVINSGVEFVLGSDGFIEGYDFLSNARILLDLIDKKNQENVANQLIKSMTRKIYPLNDFGIVKADFLLVEITTKVSRGNGVAKAIIEHGRIKNVFLEGKFWI